MKRLLCVWLPNWPIQRYLRQRSELRRAALALYEPSPQGKLWLTHVSPTAARLGARPGMSYADATARWHRRLHLASCDAPADRADLERLARELDRFSPLVGLEDAERPESLLLDITGVAALFGGERALARAASEALWAQRLSCQVAIADTLGLAWAAAHVHDTGRRQPTLVPAGESAAFLARLPVEALRLSPATLAQLAEFGLRTVGDLLSLPRSSLISRLGAELLGRLDQALGHSPETIVPVQAARQFAAAWEFETATPRTEIILAVLEPLCDSLAAALHQQGYGALELCCTLTCEPKSQTIVSVGLFEPAADAHHFFELLRLQFERLALEGPVAGLHLAALRTSQISARQRDLFGDDHRAEEWEFSLLVNRLAGRLGQSSVVRPVPRADAQPELAWREVPLLERGVPQRRRKSSSCLPSVGAGERPLFLFRPPLGIETTAISPDGPPVQFVYDGQTQQVARHFGPERIETGWWRKRGVRRDYYRVETERGGRFWLFRSLSNGRWYLQGEFA